MIVKLNSKNQITVPKKILSQLPNVEYFEVNLQDGNVVLKPLQVYQSNLDAIRIKMKKLGLGDDVVEEAIRWARSK